MNTEIDTLSNSRQRILKFRRETSMEYESRECMQAVQGGLLGGHKSTPVKHKHMLFSPACSSPLITEDLAGSWPGQYMRMDNIVCTVPQSVLYYKLPPPRVFLPATSQARLYSIHVHGMMGRKSMYVGQCL